MLIATKHGFKGLPPEWHGGIAVECNAESYRKFLHYWGHVLERRVWNSVFLFFLTHEVSRLIQNPCYGHGRLSAESTRKRSLDWGLSQLFRVFHQLHGRTLIKNEIKVLKCEKPFIGLQPVLMSQVSPVLLSWSLLWLKKFFSKCSHLVSTHEKCVIIKSDGYLF